MEPNHRALRINELPDGITEAELDAMCEGIFAKPQLIKFMFISKFTHEALKRMFIHAATFQRYPKWVRWPMRRFMLRYWKLEEEEWTKLRLKEESKGGSSDGDQ